VGCVPVEQFQIYQKHVILSDFDDLRVFSLAMQNKLELSVCLSTMKYHFVADLASARSLIE